jgi:C4-dicarboxylate-specific signal transduction histidine kinase
MNRLTAHVLAKPLLAKGLILLVSVLAGLAAVEAARRIIEHDHQDWLRNEASRRAIELIGQTMNGKVMGSMSVLGLIEPGVKVAATGKSVEQAAAIVPALEAVGASYNANGVFIVGTNGIITASWDIKGRGNTGLDVRFRSYYQMAMQGFENVYAAVSIATGERVLYFAAPVYAEARNYSSPIGAAVARVGPFQVNGILDEWKSPAFLLTPQGVVFAANREDWIYRLAGKATPERLQNIRTIKQFGTLFERKVPEALPIEVEHSSVMIDGRRYALEKVPVQWNDPMGDWTLVLTSDLEEAMPLRQRMIVGAGVGITALLLLLLGFNALRSGFQRQQAMRELQSSAEQAQARALARQKLAAISLRLQQADNLADLAHTFLIEMVDLLSLRQGAFYLLSGDGGRLDRMACYGCRDDDGTPQTLAPGEGLLGQCAADKRLQILTDPPQEYWHIASGLGETNPRAIVLAPVLHNDAVLGVVELGLLVSPDADRREILNELLPLLALTIEILRRQSGAADSR